MFKTIGKSFATPDYKNKLLFFSKAVSIIEPLAQYLVQTTINDQQTSSQLILLLDFEQE